MLTLRFSFRSRYWPILFLTPDFVQLRELGMMAGKRIPGLRSWVAGGRGPVLFIVYTILWTTRVDHHSTSDGFWIWGLVRGGGGHEGGLRELRGLHYGGGSDGTHRGRHGYWPPGRWHPFGALLHPGQGPNGNAETTVIIGISEARRGKKNRPPPQHQKTKVPKACLKRAKQTSK